VKQVYQSGQGIIVNGSLTTVTTIDDALKDGNEEFSIYKYQFTIDF